MPNRRDYKRLQHRLAQVLAPLTVRKMTKRAYEVWGPDGSYYCMVVLHPDKPLWAGTHNMVPDNTSPLFRYANPQDAVLGYAKTEAPPWTYRLPDGPWPSEESP